MRDHFAADGQPLLIFRQGVVPFDQLLLAGLDRKIGLPDRNDLLARVAVHHNEVTRITGEHHILHFPLCARTNVNHFADVGKMVLRCVPAVAARQLGALDHICEAPPLGVL